MPDHVNKKFLDSFFGKNIPFEVTINCSNPANGYGFWIKRNVSTPPNYGVVPEPEPA